MNAPTETATANADDSRAVCLLSVDLVVPGGSTRTLSMWTPAWVAEATCILAARIGPVRELPDGYRLETQTLEDTTCQT